MTWKEEKMKYKVKLFMSKYAEINGKYETVEVSRSFKFRDWDDVQCTIAYLVEGANGAVKVEIELINDNEEA